MIEAERPLYPFALTQSQISEGTICSLQGNEFAIQLNLPPWAYGCVFPPSPDIEQACQFTLDIWVQSGVVAVGTTSPGGHYFLEEHLLRAEPEWQSFTLSLPSIELRGNLVIRSGAPGVCRMMVRAGTTEILQELFAAHGEIDAIETFLATCATLTKGASPAGLVARHASPAIGGALQEIAKQVGMELISPDDLGLKGWIDALDDRLLASVAQSFVTDATAPAFPQWCFDWCARQAAPQWQLRTAIWRAMRDRCPDVALSLPWLESTHVQMPLGSDLSFPLFTLGQFEPNICRLITPMIRAGDVVIDVGANEGLYSLLAAARAGAEGLVIAVEPSPRELAHLRRNIRDNNFAERVIVVDTALDNGAGWTSFAIAEPTHGGQNAFAEIFGSALAVSEMRTVPTQTLNMLADRLGQRKVNFVKIDVEGAEFDVLQGANRLIHHHRPTWMVEIGRTGSRADWRVTKLFGDADYRLFSIDDRIGGPVALTPDQSPDGIENILAIPQEQLALRWPTAPQP